MAREEEVKPPACEVEKGRRSGGAGGGAGGAERASGVGSRQQAEYRKGGAGGGHGGVWVGEGEERASRGGTGRTQGGAPGRG